MKWLLGYLSRPQHPLPLLLALLSSRFTRSAPAPLLKEEGGGGRERRRQGASARGEAWPSPAPVVVSLPPPEAPKQQGQPASRAAETPRERQREIMADYWKSQPKKFCDYCKCWIADNKPSIDFHERGKNHKENVAKKISEIKKKSLEKAKEEEKMSKEFAAMEEAAMKAYQEDLKRLGVKAEPAGQSSTPKKQEEKKEKKAKRKKETTEISSETNEWVRGFSAEGYVYYYNTISGASQWEKPEGFQDSTQESQTVALWIEGTNEDGHTYYYNTETGVSTWEKPDGFVSQSNKSGENEHHSEESSEIESKRDKSDNAKEGNKSELQKPKRNFRRKTESDDEIEEKPRKRKKISPYGEWQEVKRETIDQEDTAPSLPKTSLAASEIAKPYGEWEEITEEEDPYEKVDLELPDIDHDSLTAPSLEKGEDTNLIFKEKTVTSLGDTEEGIPVFKKRKFENGKSRNIRQRLSDH